MLTREFTSALIFLASMVTVGPAQAQTTWYVDASNPCPGDGTPGDPFCTIQLGIGAASDFDTVLVGPGTYSFGEVFSGIMKDSGRAYLIGETTDGNIETLYGYDFQDGSRAWIAHDTFRPANNPDEDWEETGIQPHLTVPAAWDLYLLEDDPAVKAALEHLDTE